MSDQRIYVQLGRYGDILNVLPIAFEDAHDGKRSAIMVAKEFAGIMDGVSYADRIVFDGHMGDLGTAVAQAEAASTNVKVVQLIGPTELIKNVVNTRNGQEYKTVQDSFLKDHWNLAGRMSDWKRQLPLVFDRRDLQREQKLIAEHIRGKKRVILVSSAGTSSPFPYKELLHELLRLKFCRSCHVIDIATIKAERLFDLLGLFEHPSVCCLVATDSAPLHLAYASPTLPVVAFVNDSLSYWHGSVWRPNHVFHCRYRDFPKRSVEMLEAISSIGEPHNWFQPRRTTPKYIHVWSEYSDRRPKIGYYQSPLSVIQCPITVGMIGNDSKIQLKDEKRFPFVRSVIRLATMRANDDDIIILTREDTKLFPATLVNAKDMAPCFSHRIVKDGENLIHHPAVDFFAFTKKWWRDVQSKYPQDMVLGKDLYWHRVLKELVLLNGGQEMGCACYCDPKQAPPKKSETEAEPPRLANNKKLHDGFMEANNITSSFPPVHTQATITPLNRRALFPYGYNPSYLIHKKRRLMAYRFHGSGTLASWLAMAELDDNFNPITNARMQIDGVEDHLGVDDPRLFEYGGQLYCSYVVTTWPNTPPKCIVKYGRVTERVDGGVWIIQNSITVKYGQNDFTGMEKNWLFFENGGSLYCIYHNKPEQIVLQIVNDRVVDEHRSPTPHWRWGDIHGGANPVPYNGKLLRFFHTAMYNETPPNVWRYRIGAAIMEPDPPFQIVSVSTRPILTGSEIDRLADMERASCPHEKRNVVFTCGCVVDGDNILLSIGINDCDAAIVSLTEKQLHL
jgi:predicted GH43/DUF377 family glycosyl hydrolase